ncbi:MAG: FecR domain-containing protein [Parabacteroides merdae]
MFNYKYSATFTTETFEEILQLLEKTAPIKCTMIEPKQASDYSYTRRTVIIEAR